MRKFFSNSWEVIKFLGSYIIFAVVIMFIFSSCSEQSQKSYDNAYQEGYEAGKEEGYSKGYDDAEVYYQEDGYWEIYVEGYKEGYKQGYEDGEAGETFDDEY